MAYQDKELELYRGLMDRPDTYTDGFDSRSIAGAVFVGFVMMPGAIYLSLVAGVTLGQAAEWTTIILFSEIARRSFVRLNRAQIYILFYIASSLTGLVGGQMLSGGVFAQAIWLQYFVRSQAAKNLGIADKIPGWVVPPENSAALINRTFWSQDWILPSLLMVLGTILGRLNWFGWATCSSVRPPTTRSCPTPSPPSPRRARPRWPRPAARKSPGAGAPSVSGP
jgi:hypothetical protein